jgi:L-alanine-DL-glutamate epimerase-like enolase superfamily enzyme
MLITEVEALLLRQPELDASVADGSQDALVIRVHTDEGIVGVGEVDSLPSVVKAIIDAPPSHSIASGLAALLVGEDPLEVGRLWERMFRGSLYFGRRGAVLHAISGIDIALWDICGKAAGRPVSSLLGGARRRRVRAYASTLMPDTPEEVRRVVSAHCEAGFTAVKLGWGPLGRSASLDVQLVAAARSAAGDEIELMIDIGKGWSSVRDAIDRTRRFEEHRVAWVEEPFMPDDYDKYAALAEEVQVPVSAGEEETTVWDFERLIDRGGVEIVQPDVTRAGGISECMRIAALAERRGRRFIPHAWSTGIIKAATLQVLGASTQAEWFEYCVQETTLNRTLVAERFPLRDGYVEIPTAPGLGIELDERRLNECLIGSSGGS